MASVVLSIGYEGRVLDDLIALLVDHRVQVLVDVRLNPISRKPGFSKGRLTQALADAGIEYRHMPALGNPRENREAFRSGDLGVGQRIFEALLAADPAADAIRHLATLSKRHRVAVLCFERDHERCHRGIVLEQLGLPVERIA
jgi:uncharacterized protein (DUF488 family)